jgi:hypothetical protein
MGMGGRRHTPPLYPRESPGTRCIGGWLGPRVSPDGCRKFAITGIRSPDCPVFSLGGGPECGHVSMCNVVRLGGVSADRHIECCAVATMTCTASSGVSRFEFVSAERMSLLMCFMVFLRTS